MIKNTHFVDDSNYRPVDALNEDELTVYTLLEEARIESENVNNETLTIHIIICQGLLLATEKRLTSASRELKSNTH